MECWAGSTGMREPKPQKPTGRLVILAKVMPTTCVQSTAMVSGRHPTWRSSGCSGFSGVRRVYRHEKDHHK